MKFLLLIFITINIWGATVTSIGFGQNSDKEISQQKALNNAKVTAISNAGVFIKSEFESIKHKTLDGFKKEVKQKVLQESEGLVSLKDTLYVNFSKDRQIYICELKAKFDVKISDIKNSFEIMKRVDKLALQKANKTDIDRLLKEINDLKSKISNKSLGEIVNKNTINIINNIKIQNNIDIENIINTDNNITIENNTDELLYYIIGGLFLIIVIILLSKNKQTVIINPDYKQIADETIQDKKISLSLEKESYYKDEKLSINFEIKSDLEDWYIYGINIDDKKDVVFLDLIEGDKIVSNKTYIFPTWCDGYTISEPFGDDIIKIFVSNKKIPKPNLENIQSEVFISSNSRGLSNTTIQKNLSKKDNISKYDIVAYYRGFSDSCTIYERSIKYKTKERI